MPYPLGHRGLPELHRVMVVIISIEKYEKILAQEKFRGHPGLNQGPLDLQSNALPLSYIHTCLPLKSNLRSEDEKKRSFVKKRGVLARIHRNSMCCQFIVFYVYDVIIKKNNVDIYMPKMY